MMKKNTIYIAIAVLAGVLLGYLFFGNSSEDRDAVTPHDHNSVAENQMWTCSMHPQIMQPEPGDCPICGMALIPAETGADGLRPDQLVMTENALALANIQTSVVGGTDGPTSKSITLSGTIAVNEEEVAVQASYFDGRIEKLNVNYEGQQVRKGQLLATLYSPELVAAQQELLTAASLKESQPGLYQAVRKKLLLWKLTAEQIKGIEESGKVLENFPVYATVSGTVAELMSAEGDYIKKGQPIAKVSNLSTVWAAFDAYESQLSQFKTGQKISISTNAYPDRSFEVEVSFISPVLDKATRTVTVRATLDNKAGLFKPGMFVAGELENSITGMGTEKLYVPASAVMWTGERSLVYVRIKSDQPVFEMREVSLGSRLGDQYEITSGLEAGEEVVTNGTFTLDAAAQLQGKKSMMSRGRTEDMGNELDKEIRLILPDKFQKAFVKLLPTYLKMKDAFVDSKDSEVAKWAQEVLEQMKKLDRSGLGISEKEYLNTSVQLLEKIASSTSLEAQRDHFVNLNEHLVLLTSNLDSLGQTYYVQRCPMANNNKGAIWLSTEEEIRNPYYGDVMLTCGTVEQVLN